MYNLVYGILYINSQGPSKMLSELLDTRGYVKSAHTKYGVFLKVDIVLSS